MGWACWWWEPLARRGRTWRRCCRCCPQALLNVPVVAVLHRGPVDLLAEPLSRHCALPVVEPDEGRAVAGPCPAPAGYHLLVDRGAVCLLRAARVPAAASPSTCCWSPRATPTGRARRPSSSPGMTTAGRGLRGRVAARRPGRGGGRDRGRGLGRGAHRAARTGGLAVPPGVRAAREGRRRMALAVDERCPSSW